MTTRLVMIITRRRVTPVSYVVHVLGGRSGARRQRAARAHGRGRAHPRGRSGCTPARRARAPRPASRPTSRLAARVRARLPGTRIANVDEHYVNREAAM